MNMDKE